MKGGLKVEDIKPSEQEVVAKFAEVDLQVRCWQKEASKSTVFILITVNMCYVHLFSFRAFFERNSLCFRAWAVVRFVDQVIWPLGQIWQAGAIELTIEIFIHDGVRSACLHQSRDVGGTVSAGKERNIFELNLNVSSSLELREFWAYVREHECSMLR